MKRALLGFAAIFGLGLVLLLVLDRRRPRAPQVAPPASSVPAAEQAASQPSAIARGGQSAMEISVYAQDQGDRRPRVALLRCRESDPPANGWIECRGIELESFDAQSGELVAKLAAASGRMPALPGSQALELRFGDLIELRAAHGDWLRAGLFAPLALEAPLLVVELEARRARSEGAAKLEGRALLAEGEGLTLALEGESVSFEQNARVRLDVADQPPLRVSSKGPLELSRRPAQAGAVEGALLRARESARIDVGGEGALTLLGDELVLQAARGNAADAPWIVNSLAAIGAASAARHGFTLAGERADFEFDELGQPSKLAFTGEPNARVPLDSMGATEPALLTGAGPLSIGLVGEREWTMLGPAKLEWRGVELAAAERLFGSLPEATRERGAPSQAAGDERPVEARLSARGQVVLTRAEGRLSTETLDIESGRDAQQQAWALASASGPSSATGSGADEEEFTLATRELLQVELSRAGWRVPLALGVELHRAGDEPLEAHAERVLDFDGESGAFVAQGEVRFTSGERKGGGDRLTSRGPTHALLEGSQEKPAWIESPTERASAHSVEADGDLLTLRGSVSLRYADEARSATALSETLRLRRTERELEDGGREVRVELSAETRVDAQLREGVATYDLRCEGFEATGIETFDAAGQRVARNSTLAARGLVRGDVRSGEDDWEISADSLLASSEEHEDAAGAHGVARSSQLDAYGDVRLRRKTGQHLVGRGERLSLAHDGSGRLDAEPGGRVFLEAGLGTRSGGGFDALALDAPWIEFGEQSLRAEDPNLALSRELPPELAGIGIGVPALLRAQAGEVIVDARSVRFLRGVQMQGALRSGEAWTLAAREAQLTGEAGEGELAQRLETLSAQGDFSFELGERLSARGERFRVAKGSWTVELEGDPLTARFLGFQFRSRDVLSFNLELGTMSSGAGSIRPLGGASRAAERQP